MSTLLSNNEFKIVSYENNLYKIQFYSLVDNSEALIKSLVKTQLIIGATVTSNYKTIQFKTNSIQTFSLYLSEKINKLGKIPFITIVNMLKTLTIQLEYLICKHSKTFLGFDLERILVIDDDKFVYLSNEYLLDITPDEKVTITVPFSKNEFHHGLAPEMLRIDKLPAKIHYKVSYYSLASLCVHFLVNNNDNLELKYMELLDNSYINGSKIYWVLKRCLQETVEERSIIFF